MKTLMLTLVLLVVACAPSKNPMEPVEEYIPEPVVQVWIVDGDTTYDANQ